MIQGINITKSFGDLILFKNFSFCIEDGDFVCFSGKSGKGKTTLLNMIGLLEPIDDGKILINGREYRTNHEKMLLYRTELGFLFQNFALIEDKTVKENLELVSKRSRTEYSVNEVLCKVGMEAKINNKVYTLSGGEQQRVALARLFFKKCNIILADEPTGSLDKENAAMVMNIICELSLQGKTIILVTHDELIKKMAKRVIEL